MGGSLINSVAQDGQGAVPAGQLNAYLQTVPNLAALRGFIPQGPMAIQLQGYVSQADGGQGIFTWASGATGPDNGTTVIQPTGVAVGCWIRDDPAAKASGNLTVQDEGGNIVTAVGTITFAGSGTAEVTVAPPTGTGSATVTVTVNAAYFKFQSGD